MSVDPVKGYFHGIRHVGDLNKIDNLSSYQNFDAPVKTFEEDFFDQESIPRIDSPDSIVLEDKKTIPGALISIVDSILDMESNRLKNMEELILLIHQDYNSHLADNMARSRALESHNNGKIKSIVKAVANISTYTSTLMNSQSLWFHVNNGNWMAAPFLVLSSLLNFGLLLLGNSVHNGNYDQMQVLKTIVSGGLIAFLGYTSSNSTINPLQFVFRTLPKMLSISSSVYSSYHKIMLKKTTSLLDTINGYMFNDLEQMKIIDSDIESFTSNINYAIKLVSLSQKKYNIMVRSAIAASQLSV